MKRYLVFDIGATNYRLAIGTSSGDLGEAVVRSTNPGKHGFDEIVDQMRLLVGDRPIAGIAGGMNGTINAATGTVFRTPNLPLWNGLAIREQLEHAFQVPVLIENDVVVVGLGEAKTGAGRNYNVVVYMTISTGINGAKFVDGRIDRTGQGSQLGYQILKLHHGGGDSLEYLAGGRSLERRYGRPARQLAHDTVIWQRVQAAVIAGLYNTMLYWSPDAIVLGGSMMRDLSLDRLRRGLVELSPQPPVYKRFPELVLAEHGDLGGLHGALAWLRQGGV